MKAAILNRRGQLELADLGLPKIGRAEMLVRMKACGICGTDLEKVHGAHVTPPVLGHEVAGDVEEIGSDVKAYSRGDRVVVHHHVPCHSCFYCRHGHQTMCSDFPKSNLDPCGFAEYFRIPEINVSKGAVFHIPSGMTYEEAAFAEPTGCCIRALNTLGVQSGDDILIIGSGPAGLTHVQLLRALGAAQILVADVVESRLRWAEKFGADTTLNASKDDLLKSIRAVTEGRGVDKVIVASGNAEAIQSSLPLVRKGGKILLFGIPPKGSTFNCDVSDVFIRETTFISSYSTTEKEMETALEMMAADKIRLTEMITHRFRLAEIAEAFRVAEDARSSLKVMVET